jgi:tripartite-type tricarboxylate transporter receptor subunit TctC
MAESGFPDAGIDSWLGYHAPAGTPPEAVKRLMTAVAEAAANEEVRTRFNKLGAESAYLDTPAFTAFLETDLNRARRVVDLMAKQRR